MGRFDRPLRLARATKKNQSSERRAASMRWISRSSKTPRAPQRSWMTQAIGR
jgi:hypothetical protein